VSAAQTGEIANRIKAVRRRPSLSQYSLKLFITHLLFIVRQPFQFNYRSKEDVTLRRVCVKSLTPDYRRENGTITGKSMREEALNLHQADGEQPFHAFVEAVEKSPKKLIISLFIFSKR